MKDFIKRNSPIFAIGGFTVLVFLIIIISASNRPIKQKPLIKLDENELIATHTYVKGPKDAPLAIVVFSDYSCPYCADVHVILNTLSAENPDKIRLALRHFPLTSLKGHENSDLAAEAAQIAGEQNKFWEYSDLLFEKPQKHDRESLIEYAGMLGLDVDKFTKDLDSKTFSGIVKLDRAFALKNGFEGTPTIFVNGEKVDFKTLDEFKKIVLDRIASIAKNTSDKNPSIDKKPPVGTISPILQPEVFDSTYPPIVATFKTDSFDLTGSAAVIGQKIIWKNPTEKEIEIKINMPTKIQGGQDIIKIAPNGEYESRFTDKEYFTFVEMETKAWAKIFIDKK